MFGEINVTYRVTRTLPAPEQATWRTLLAEFTAEVPTPEKVEVVMPTPPAVVGAFDPGHDRQA